MPKHSGCFACGNESQDILDSVVAFTKNKRDGTEMQSVALCKPCRAQYENSKEPIPYRGR